MSIIILIAAGLAAGVVSGMGIGGGTILIPALTLLIGMEQHAAQSANLLYFLPTAAAALFFHIKNKRIEKELLLPMILPGLLFAAAGAFIALQTEPELLRKLFGGFLLIAGVMEFFKKPQGKG